MRFLKSLSLTLALVTASALLFSPVRPAPRMTLEDRLAEIEDRLDTIEDRLDRQDEARGREVQTDRLTLESEAKLDRLEVRVIQLEGRSSEGSVDGPTQRQVLERLRSLERQVARLRATGLR